MTTAALVLAAGRGERLGAGLPKALVPLAGVPLVVRAIAAVAACPEIDRVVPVIPPGEASRFAPLLAGLGPSAKLAAAVEGGAERQDSVRAGLAALGPECRFVAVHDAARALVRSDDVSRVVAAARRHGAALLAVPARDTIKRVRDGRVLDTPPRAECWAAQTPQVFRTELLREALAKADAEGFVGTDDAQLVERLGVEVRVVEGDPGNLKITGPGDLAAAEAWLRALGGARA
jgi:2-C-methyl-D-erythritol 4-phosphate cytidylyltransferase